MRFLTTTFLLFSLPSWHSLWNIRSMTLHVTCQEVSIAVCDTPGTTKCQLDPRYLFALDRIGVILEADLPLIAEVILHALLLLAALDEHGLVAKRNINAPAVRHLLREIPASDRDQAPGGQRILKNMTHDFVNNILSSMLHGVSAACVHDLSSLITWHSSPPRISSKNRSMA